LRTFRHWTPRYVRDRLAVFFYEKKYPERPWLTSTAFSILTSWLKQSDSVLEFGSGRSTLWLARRVSAITSVEHDKEWFERVSRKANHEGLTNLDYRLIETHEGEIVGLTHAYSAVVHCFGTESIDCVLVDGVHRDACANSVLPYIKPGGLLILDNANWYLPSDSLAPQSRTLEQGPSSHLWSQFIASVKDWRFIWTTNGVWDTAIYIKPCDSLVFDDRTTLECTAGSVRP